MDVELMSNGDGLTELLGEQDTFACQQLLQPLLVITDLIQNILDVPL